MGLLHRRFVCRAPHGWKLEVFGGSRRDGQVESRTFKAEYDTAADRFVDNPWPLTIAVGSGKTTGTGGIAPNDDPTTRVSMRFPAMDVLDHMLEIQDFLRAHQLDIELVRQAEQLRHYHERQECNATYSSAPTQRRDQSAAPSRMMGSYLS